MTRAPRYTSSLAVWRPMPLLAPITATCRPSMLPDTGTLSGDLREFLRATVGAVDPPTVSVLRHLAAAAAADEHEALQIRDRFLARRRAPLGELLDRAAARGEISARQATLALDLIFGSLCTR